MPREKTDTLMATRPQVRTTVGEADTTRINLSAHALAISRNAQDAGNGYTTMLQRLFHVSERSKEPKVESMATMENMLGSDNGFLTHADRDFLAYAYQFSAEQGISPGEVDQLASDLGAFRFMQATGNHIEVKPGERREPGAPPYYWLMTPSDSTIASRILTSSAAAATPLDHGFIAYVLNPRGRGWTNADCTMHDCSFAFLEKIINASGANTLIKVDPDNPEPLYQNSLYWIRHQDIPDLSPPASSATPATATRNDPAMFGNLLRDNAQNSHDYAAQAMELRKLHQDAPKPGTRSEKMAAYRARALERQKTMTSLLRDFIASRLGSF